MTTKENVDSVINLIAECYVKKKSKIFLKKLQEEKEETKIPSVIDAAHDELLNNDDEHRSAKIFTRIAEPNPIIEHSPRLRIKEMNKTKWIKLRQICVFPIKSCAPFRVNSSWPVTRRGLKYDREWMIVQANGLAVTQKNDTKLCLIQPAINEAANKLQLNFPYTEPITIPLEFNMRNNRVQSSLCQSKVCGDRIDAIDCGDDVAHWLSDVLCMSGVRLIKQAVDDKRTSKKSKQKGFR